VSSFAGLTFKMISELPKYLYYCVILIIYIYICMICKYSRGSRYTVRRVALWTALRYIIETRCEILVTLRHTLFRLITLLTFRLDFSTVSDNNM